MTSATETDSTRSLVAYARGSPEAAAELMPLVYANLRALGAITPGRIVDALALEQALEKLTSRNRRHGQIAELRLYAGLSEKETGYILHVSERTVRQDWRLARAWLSRELSSSRNG